MPNALRLTRPASVVLLWILLWPAWANDTPLTYDRIDFSVAATRQVENDTLIAILYVQREGEKAERLMDEVNRSIRWGLEQARNVPGLKIQTLDYHTQPVYRDQKLLGWRVSQSIRLQSSEAAQLSQIIGTLQERLAVRSIRYAVSPALRLRVENELIGEAIQAFSKRADLITARLGRRGHRLVQMNVNSSGTPPIRGAPQLMSMRAEAAVAPPALEAGTQSLRVDVSGTIELKLD